MKNNGYTASVITVSDKAAAGLRVDKSGPAAATGLEKMGFEIVRIDIVSDDKDYIRAELIKHSDQGINLIITSGGTGAAPRDNTPEVTLEVGEREMPGLSELMRIKGMEITPFSVLSRGRSVIRGKSLIVNLPGSPKAVVENLQILEPVIEHAIKMLIGKDIEH
ncbi:MAG: MogA/MoaB family molybdenum cofactor biosynthesis protein [Spirochaetales bacterium]|nr:MogA/MoaB family molybdenum cofactor biosynthesis protein [Spirochaetales bacterium]